MHAKIPLAQDMALADMALADRNHAKDGRLRLLQDGRVRMVHSLPEGCHLDA